MLTVGGLSPWLGERLLGLRNEFYSLFLCTRGTVLRSPSMAYWGQLGCRTRHAAGRLHAQTALWLHGLASLEEERGVSRVKVLI